MLASSMGHSTSHLAEGPAGFLHREFSSSAWLLSALYSVSYLEDMDTVEKIRRSVQAGDAIREAHCGLMTGEALFQEPLLSAYR